MNGWGAFRSGMSRVWHYRRVLLILFTVNLASALLLAVLPALGLARGFGLRPAIRQAADGVDAWLVIETLMSPVINAALRQGGVEPTPTGGLSRVALLGLITIAALPFLAWLPAAFLSGGVLLTYAEAPQQFGWRRFVWGSGHWFGAFVLLGVAQGIAATVVFVPAIVAAAAAIAAAGWLVWIAVPLLAFLAALWTALMECTRILTVTRGTRNIARAFGGAARFVVHNFPALAGLYGLAFLALGLAHALYQWGLRPHLPLDWWPLVLLVQQAFVLARLGLRLVRLAGGVALIQAGSVTGYASGTGGCARPAGS